MQPMIDVKNYKDALKLLFKIKSEKLNFNLNDFNNILKNMPKALYIFNDKNKVSHAIALQYQVSVLAEEFQKYQVAYDYSEQILLTLIKININNIERYVRRILHIIDFYEVKCDSIDILLEIGTYLVECSDLENTYKYLSKGLNLAYMKNDNLKIISFLKLLQKYSYKFSDYEMMINYAEEAIDVAEKENDIDILASLKNNIGAAYVGMEKYKEAAEVFDESSEILKNNTENQIWYFNALMNSGIANSELKNFDLSRKKYNEAKLVVDNLNDEDNSFLLKLNVGNDYFNQNKYEEALEIYNDVELFYRKKDNFIGIKNIIECKYKLFHKLNNFKSACVCMEELVEIREKIFNSEIALKAAEFKNSFEAELKEKERKIILQKNNELRLRNMELEKAHHEIRSLEQKNSIYAMAVTANHEVNQPLTTLQGNLELLGDSILNEKQKQYAIKMQESIDRISILLEKYRNQSQFKFVNYTNETMMISFEDES